ncbi:MAG: glycosyltransferase family 4 protein, partial [Anaerolineaceae bacterium]|nr:glycosyltransferase family 4 protein [Anaerolineaceae bacterium]
ACGVPVVAFAVGGVMDVIRHKETGWLVTPGDVDGLAKAIITLLSDTTLRRRLGAAARQEIKQHYHPDQIYPCYEALLSGQELEQD